MPVLTWKNVDAPDYRGSMQGYKVAGELLSNAAKGWQDQLSADDELAKSQLVQQGLAQQQAQTGYLNNRMQTQNSLVDANAPVLNALSVAASRNDRAGVESLLKNNPGLTQLPPEVLTSTLGNNNKLMDGTQRALFEHSNQAYKTYGQNREITANTGADYANGVMANIMQNHPTAGTGVPALRAAIDAAPTPEARIALMTQGNKLFPDSFGPIDIGVAPEKATTGEASSSGSKTPAATSPMGALRAASTPETAGTKAGSPYDVGYQFQKTPFVASQTKMGDIVSHQANMIKTQGASPMGAFQINKATLEDFGPKVLGANWKEQPFSAENQEKLGEAIFNARKDGNLKGTWEALPDTTPGAYKDKTWAEMRDVISKAEVGSGVGAPVLDTDTKQVRRIGEQQAGVKLSQMNSPLLAAVTKARETNRFSQDVVADLKKLPGFKGMSEAEIGQKLEDVKKKIGDENYDVAAAVLQNGMQPGSDNWLMQKFGASPNYVFDDKKIKTGVDAIINSRVDAQAESINVIKDVGATIEKYAKKTDDAKALLDRLDVRIANGDTTLGAQRALVAARYEAANTEWKAQNARRVTDASLQPRYPGLDSAKAAQKALSDAVKVDAEGKTPNPPSSTPSIVSGPPATDTRAAYERRPGFAKDVEEDAKAATAEQQAAQDPVIQALYDEARKAQRTNPRQVPGIRRRIEELTIAKYGSR